MSAPKSRGCEVVNRTRRIPGASATARSNSENRIRRTEGSAYEFTVWPSSCTSEYPNSASSRTSFNTESLARLRSGPRVNGTTQYAQALSHPSIIVKYARHGLSRRVTGVSKVSSVSLSSPVTRRATHQADPWRSRENILALLLRHAAKHSDHLTRRLFRSIFPQPRKNFLRRFLPDAARVVQNQGSDVRRFHLPIPARKQHARDFFRVVVVHLAAESFQEKSSATRVGFCRRARRGRVLRSNRTSCQRVQTDVKCPGHLPVRSLAQSPRSFRARLFTQIPYFPPI